MLRNTVTTLMLVTVGSLAGCYGADDSGGGDEQGMSAVSEALTVGGHRCPTHGEIAGRTVPADHQYFLTTFGGGRDTGRMACGRIADGRWLYMADKWRFGCGAHVRIENPRDHSYCIVEVADVGPNICVEQAAHRPIIDASPLVAEHLFGASSAGWSDHFKITVTEVPKTTALGICD